MAWFGDARSFYSSCLMSYANSLASIPTTLPLEKVEKLISFCPPLTAADSSGGNSCVLHDRHLAAVVALGLFAVKTEAKVHEDIVVGYLVKLLRATMRANWVQNSEVTAKKDGLIAEQFCFKLNLILSNVSVFCEPQWKEKIHGTQLEVLKYFVRGFVGQMAQWEEKQDELYLVTLSALLGITKALLGTSVIRREAFWTMCQPQHEPWKEDNSKWEWLSETGEDKKYSMALFEVVLRLLRDGHIKVLEQKLEQLEDNHQPLQGYSQRCFLGNLLHYSMICLMRDVITAFPDELSDDLRGQVYKLVEQYIFVGVQELSLVMGCTMKGVHMVQVMCVAVELLVWSVHGDSEIESSFQRLSSLLTVHTSKLNVLVMPLRASLLQAMATLAGKSTSLVSLALTRCKDFMTSKLLQKMYGDALSATGSSNLDLPFMLLEEPKPSSFSQCTFLPAVHFSRQDAFIKVLQTLASTICSLLLTGSVEQPNCVKGFLEPLGNLLYATDSDAKASIAECIVMLLGQVAVVMKEKHNVLETVVRIFQQRLFRPSSNLDGMIVIEVGKIAGTTGESSSSLELLSQLMGLSLGEATPTAHSKEKITYNHIYQPVVNSLVYMANHLQESEERQELMLKSLQLFVQQGIEAKKASDRADATHKATSSSFSLGLMLPVIATLMKRMEPIVNPTQRVVKIFRDFWLYCIIMGFSDFQIGVFPSAWYENVREIATKSPLLLSVGAEQYLDKELELNHPLKIEVIAPGELQEARQSLIEKLGKSPELDKLVYHLTFVQCMYLTSIYRLESLRLEVNTKVFADIFKYLEDKGLQGELWVAVEMTGSKLFAEYLAKMEAKPAGSDCTQELESLTQLLLFKFNHLRGRIKKVADDYLSKLVDKFPHLLWSKKVIHTQLDLLQELSLNLLSMEQSTATSAVVKLSYLEHSIVIPDNATKREKTVSYFATRCQQIIELALKWAPVETKLILEEYLCHAESASTGLGHHTSISLAASLISNYVELNTHSKHIPSAVVSKWPSCLKDTVSQPFSKLYFRSRCMGEVEGMLSRHAGLEASGGMKKLSSNLIQKLEEALKNGSTEDLTIAMYRVTALIIINKESLDRRLLYSVSQLPVKEFRELSISLGIDCWHWLIASREDLEYRFMREFAAAWKWTAEEGKGIFTADPPSSSLKTNQRPPLIPIRQHVLLIKFLTDRLEVIKTRDAAQLSLIVELLHQSLTLGVGPTSFQPQLLSHAPEAVTPRFQLLLLALTILKEQLLSSTLEKTVLRERVYNSALDFFSYDPKWPVDNVATVRETVSTLIKFWQCLKELKNVATAGQLPNAAFEASTSVPRNNSSFWQLAFNAESSPAQGSWMNVVSATHNRTKSQTLNLTGLQIPQQSSRKSSTLAKRKVLLKRKNVILALVKHEIERLSVWHNLAGQADWNIPGEEVVSGWVNPTQTERHWRSTIIMVFHTSPHLAFQLTNRFKTVDFIIKEVTRLIHTHPVAFSVIPDAAQYLAKKEYVIQNAPELYHLLYWRDVPPASTLIFFSKPFSHHPITAQFASKAMTCFQPDDILLYIPQLVQTVRYDKLGFAKEYIVTAGKKSQLLAHQFLWNMEANEYLDEDRKQKDPEIGDILGELCSRIKANLSGAALMFYEREFSFFKKITDISGTIRPFPKEKRRKECHKALQEIVLEPGVYLPSNPDSVLLEIDYTSGIPMQSAAKAPFLAKFRVAKCGTAQVEHMNISEDARCLSELPVRFQDNSVWQGCIFKVGDDVRQDMLALQIMQLFKDVFEGVGLDLYLVPYRVIATAMGCGVIECVPNAKSRDQIGKATQVSLRAYFNSIYGDVDSVPFQKARVNFIKSMSAYSLISYILQIKDRHNGNIMIDKDGHIIHIDFGFLFESSPGGNMGFEPDLKLTEEMLEVMGGKKTDAYRWFVELCVKGYLALRPYQDQVVSLVTLMLDTGLPCFRGNTIEPLKARFHPQHNEKDAAKAIIEVVETACLSLRTLSYDVIQDIQQKIYYHKKD